MANASKGDRTRYSTRLPVDVANAFEEIRIKTGVRTASQFLSDLVSLICERPEHVRELGQTASPEMAKLLSELGEQISELGLAYRDQAEEELPLTA